MIACNVWNPGPAARAQQVLIALALNAAAGVACPTAAPAPLTRDAYVARIVGDLLDDGSDFPIADRAEATVIVNRALDQLLVRAGVAFGDPGEDWDLAEDDVVELAYALAEAGDQVDLEDAIALAESPDRELAE